MPLDWELKQLFNPTTTQVTSSPAAPDQPGQMRNVTAGTPQPVSKPKHPNRRRRKEQERARQMTPAISPGLQAPGAGIDLGGDMFGGAPSLDAILSGLMGSMGPNRMGWQTGGGLGPPSIDDVLRQTQPINPTPAIAPGLQAIGGGGGDFQSILDRILRSIMGPQIAPGAMSGGRGGIGERFPRAF